MAQYIDSYKFVVHTVTLSAKTAVYTDNSISHIILSQFIGSPPLVSEHVKNNRMGRQKEKTETHLELPLNPGIEKIQSQNLRVLWILNR